MKITRHPFRYKFKEKFPDAKSIAGFEGGRVFRASKDNKHYLIIDEGTLADILEEEDKDILDQLVKVIEFETEEELNHYLGERYDNFAVFWK